MNTHIEEVAPAAKKDKGFTLVELLIVIVILGILSTVTVFAVRGITNKGQTSACAADKATLATASEAYFSQYGTTEIATGVYGVGLNATQTPTGTDSAGAVIGSQNNGTAFTAAQTPVALTTTLDSVGDRSNTAAVARPVVTPAVTWSAGATPADTLVNAGLLRSPSKNLFVHKDGKIYTSTTACTGTAGAEY
jgi:general secretion pathway protein G